MGSLHKKHFVYELYTAYIVLSKTTDPYKSRLCPHLLPSATLKFITAEGEKGYLMGSDDKAHWRAGIKHRRTLRAALSLLPERAVGVPQRGSGEEGLRSGLTRIKQKKGGCRKSKPSEGVDALSAAAQNYENKGET